MKTLCAAACVAFATGLCFGESWTGVKTVDVAFGQTVQLDATEALTGDGSILKTGGGTLLLGNANNTFSGGIETQEGYVKTTAVGSLGTGPITFSGSYKGNVKMTNQVWFAVSGTYPNAIIYRMTDASHNLNGANGIEQANVRVEADVTLTADIKLLSKGLYLSPTKNHTLTLSGTVWGRNPGDTATQTQTLYAWFTGTIDCKTLWGVSLDISSWAHEGGRFILRNQGKVTSVSIARSILDLRAKDILGDNTTQVQWTAVVNSYVTKRGNPDPTNMGYIELNGYSQKCIKTLWSAGQKITSCLNASSIRSTTASATATLQDIGYNVTAGLRFDGMLDIDYDSAHTLVLTSRVHTTTGKLTVRQGRLALTGDASMDRLGAIDVLGGTLSDQGTWPNGFASVTNVHVAANATLEFSPETLTPFGTLARKCVLTVEDDGVLTVPAGVELHVSSFSYHGTDYALGSYAGGDWGEGTVVVQPFEPAETVSLTWTGGGAGDTSVQTSANWDGGTFNPLDVSALPLFASGGETALFDTSAYLKGLRFQLPQGRTAFALNRAADETLRLYSQGVRSLRAADDLAAKKTYTVDLPVLLEKTQLWEAATNDTVVFKKPVSSKSSADLYVTGRFLNNANAGEISFEGGLEDLQGNLVISNGLVNFTGNVGSADNTFGQVVTHGYWGGCTHYFGETTLWKTSCWNSCNVPDCPGGNVQDAWLRFTDDSLTTFKGYVYSQRSFKAYANNAQSTVIFEGGASFVGKCFMRGAGSFVFRNKPIVMTGIADKYPSTTGGDFMGCDNSTTKIVFEVPDNQLVNLYLNYNGSTVEFRTNYVQSLTASIKNDGNRLGILKGTLDFTTTTQRFERVWATGGKMKGRYPATVEANLKAGQESAIRTQFEGWLGLSQIGAGRTTVSNTVSQSYGDLYVSQGTLRLDADSSWCNGTNVTVTGSGTLALCADNQLNRRCTRLLVGGEGKVDIAASKTIKVREAYLNGAALAPGTYTKAQPKALAGHLTGDGTLMVCGGGIVVIVR